MPVDRSARLEHDGESEERSADERIGERRNERRDRLAVWRSGVTLDVRDATEEKESESLDRNAACARGERVCHLVHDERGKEADRGSGAENDENDGATRDVQAIGHGEQRPRRKSEREDPAPIDGDLDASDTSETDPASHRCLIGARLVPPRRPREAAARAIAAHGSQRSWELTSQHP